MFRTRYPRAHWQWCTLLIAHFIWLLQQSVIETEKNTKDLWPGKLLWSNAASYQSAEINKTEWQLRSSSGKGQLFILSISVNWVKNMTHDDFWQLEGQTTLLFFPNEPLENIIWWASILLKISPWDQKRMG